MSFIASYFRFSEHQTDIRRETLGGITTFVTMAYIAAVNPAVPMVIASRADRPPSGTTHSAGTRA